MTLWISDMQILHLTVNRLQIIFVTYKHFEPNLINFCLFHIESLEVNCSLLWINSTPCYTAPFAPVYWINSLAPGKFELNFRHAIFKRILVIDDWGISCEIALTWKPQDLTDDKSTLVQVMAWCRQATSHYLSQCWPSFLSPYGITRPPWVKYHWFICLCSCFFVLFLNAFCVIIK